MMNKFKILAILIVVLLFGESAGFIYFARKSQGLSRELESFKPGYEKLTRAELELKNKYSELSKENEAMRIDRENLLSQIKSLLAERSRANELAGSLEKANDNLSILGREKKELQDYSSGLKDELSKLRQAQEGLVKERDELKSAYEKESGNTGIKELKKRISDLQKENKGIESNLKRKEKEFDKFVQQKSKLGLNNESLVSQLKDFKRNYDNALKKNRALEQELKNIPVKFTEIARQNKKLIKETAQMHYNLGVFYTKNKQYDRAVAEFEKVIDVDPDDAYAHFNLGYIYAQYLVNRQKAVEQFRHFLRLAKSDDKDADWVKKYLLTWEAYEGKRPMQ